MTTTISPSLGHGPLTQQGTGTTPGYDAIDVRRLVSPGLQEGVLSSGSYMVTQRGAGANLSVDIAASTGDGALVQGDAVTAQGLYLVAPHSAVINETITTAHATLPRIDQVVLEIKDTQHDASGSNLAQTRVVAGTATGGATLDNRTGAAALPSSAVLLADVLVAATDTAISNAEIRDRRPWARGANFRIVRNQNAAAGNDYTTTAAAIALVDGTNLAPRIECSGAPVRVTLAATWSHSAGTGSLLYFSPLVDSAGVNGMASVGGSGSAASITAQATGTLANLGLFQWEFTPAAGSHVIAPGFGTSAATLSLLCRTAQPLVWKVEELVQQDAKNNSTTTG